MILREIGHLFLIPQVPAYELKGDGPFLPCSPSFRFQPCYLPEVSGSKFKEKGLLFLRPRVPGSELMGEGHGLNSDSVMFCSKLHI